METFNAEKKKYSLEYNGNGLWFCHECGISMKSEKINWTDFTKAWEEYEKIQESALKEYNKKIKEIENGN